jgi:hypothetical protein
MFTLPRVGRVFRRYLQMYPENSEDYIEYLVSIDRYSRWYFLPK